MPYHQSDPRLPQTALQLKGSDAAQAIKAIADRPDFWSMDCATFVQVVELNALRETLGASEFNRYMHESKQRTRGMIVLMPHYSTGLWPKYGYGRDEDTGHVQRIPSGPPGPLQEMKALAASVPSGSEVVFHNPNAPGEHAFLYENAIKIGADKYLAYGVGDVVMSGQSILREMARMRFPDEQGHLSPAHKPDTIQISSIQVWDFFAQPQ